MRERRDRLWIPFELPSSGRGRQSRLRELPLCEGPGDSSGTAIVSIFVPRFLLDNIQAKASTTIRMRGFESRFDQRAPPQGAETTLETANSAEDTHRSLANVRYYVI
jgi:hypothetical protein